MTHGIGAHVRYVHQVPTKHGVVDIKTGTEHAVELECIASCDGDVRANIVTFSIARLLAQ